MPTLLLMTALSLQDEGASPESPGRSLQAILDQMRRSAEHLHEAATRPSCERQAEAIRALSELLRQAREADRQRRSDRRAHEERVAGERSGDGAPRPYERRDDGVQGGRFVSRGDGVPWSDLPPRMRDAILHGLRDIDEYPVEFRETLRRWSRVLAGARE
jgi:hypothetical protein